MQKSLFLYKQNNRKAQKNNKFLYPLSKTGICYQLNCTPKVGQVKHYPVIERVRYCTGLFPFNRALILLLL